MVEVLTSYVGDGLGSVMQAAIDLQGADGNLLGFLEVKSGNEKQDPKQAKKDEYLRRPGYVINVAYEDMGGLLYR